ncbi:MAG: AMP-dependent synthetase/ligase [Planctomycetota bacterium]|jgi:long-chain acyl-CoA synthetase
MESCPTIPRLIDHLAERHGDRILFPRRDSKGGAPVSYRELHGSLRRLAAGLLASGIQLGDRVALISENRFEWMLCDLACAYVGIIDVPRGTDTAGQELQMILSHSGCRFAFVENQATAAEIMGMRDQLPALQEICMMTWDSESGGDALQLSELIDRGDRWLAANPGQLEQASEKVKAQDIATIVYTSGTTADPKGVVLSHGNLRSNMIGVNQMLDFDQDDVFLSVLPAWHTYERMIDYVALCAGATIWFTDRRQLKDDLKTIKPTAFAGVPRIWESIHDGIVNFCHKQPGMKRRLLAFVIDNCRRVGDQKAGPLRRALHAIFRRGILPKFLGSTGGQLRIAVSGGGSLPRHVDACLMGMGLPILNGYGLTETSPVAALRTPENNCVGTIGQPIPETSFEVRDDSGRVLPAGEIGTIWIRGPQIMKGYFRSPDRTAEIIDANGWFNSGDLGRVDGMGNYSITGRAKDTIVLASGENVEPEHLETQLKTSPFIDQAVVLGQDRKTLGTILVPMVECLEREIPRHDWGEDEQVLRSQEVQKFFRRELDRLLSKDAGFRPTERIAQFRVIIEPFSSENGLLTQTLKVRRHLVVSKHQGLIEEIFS